jgi:hypothetical protein
VVKSLTAFVGEGGRVGCVCTRRGDIDQKKQIQLVAATCTQIKKHYTVILKIQIHLAKRFLPANFGIKYAYTGCGR